MLSRALVFVVAGLAVAVSSGCDGSSGEGAKKITFYDEDGREIATVSGLRGRWRQDDDAMVARGDVVLLVHADSSRIESQEIHYDPNAERVWSDSATVQTLKDGTVTSGSSFESDIDFENVDVRDPRGDVGRIF